MASKKKQLLSLPRNVALCYVRLSYTRVGDDPDSPERQRANILATCQARGWIPEWYQDVDGHKSGRHEKNRPGWLALKARLGDPDVVALVANDLARLHRKGWRVGNLLEFVEEHGVTLVLAAPGRNLDMSSPMGRVAVMIAAMMDEYYAADVAQRQKDNVAYRRGLGKSVGIPPFGSVRAGDGYLRPSHRGAWLMPDRTHIAGRQGEAPPDPQATWRGYYDCAERILNLYKVNKEGMDTIAYQMNSEGWAFKDRWGNPRPITRDDIRRVVGAWREYAGLVVGGRAKDRNASLIENPTEILYDTGHAIFDLELLRLVGEVQSGRSVTLRAPGIKQHAHPYALTNLLFCAHCEQSARDKNNPTLRSPLSGWNRYGTLRYRHVEGRQCATENRSVPIKCVEDDFSRLINLLTVSTDALPLLVELSIQSERAGQSITDSGIDPEAEKQQAIAKYKRRIEAARHLYEDGDLSREEYLKRKEQNEREIAHWEARTTETEKAALELAMCMEAVDKLARLWNMASDEDRQGMARTLFEYVVYDLDTRRITDFRLKSWADRFLVLRASLYDDHDLLKSGNDDSGAESGTPTDVSGDERAGHENEKFHLKDGTVSCPHGELSRFLDYSAAHSALGVYRLIILVEPQRRQSAMISSANVTGKVHP